MRRWQGCAAMHPQLLVHIQSWGGRAAAITGYLCSLGLAGCGAALIGAALLLAVFTRADGTAAAALLGGVAFTVAGGLTLAWQLRQTYLDLRQRAAIPATPAEPSPEG